MLADLDVESEIFRCTRGLYEIISVGSRCGIRLHAICCMRPFPVDHDDNHVFLLAIEYNLIQREEEY